MAPALGSHHSITKDMSTKEDKLIKALIALEPVIKKAGDLAVKMRRNATVSNKYQTGIHGIDIVTSADLSVQEEILSNMAQTKLNECQLIAEEKTISITKFKNQNRTVLTLDPIDGTELYASDKNFFSIIVGLHDQRDIFYTFNYYPVFNAGYRITKNGVQPMGNLPNVKTKNGINLEHTIVHTFGNPKESAPEMHAKLTEEGYVFHTLSDITDESGSCTLFYLNQVAGYFKSNPNAYDGLVALHYGKTQKMRIYSTLNMSETLRGSHGPYYPGWYFVLRK